MSTIDDFLSQITEILFPATVDDVPVALQRYRGEVVRKDCHVVMETIKTDLEHPIHENVDRLLTKIDGWRRMCRLPKSLLPAGVSSARRPAESSTRCQTD